MSYGKTTTVQLPVKDSSGRCKVHNLSPDDPNASVITSVQLEHHGGEQLGGVDLLGAGQDRTSLACAWRTIEQEVRELVIPDEGPDGVDDVLVRDELIKGVRAVLFYPRKIRRSFFDILGISHSEG